jgi:hypothetical protein
VATLTPDQALDLQWFLRYGGLRTSGVNVADAVSICNTDPDTLAEILNTLQQYRGRSLAELGGVLGQTAIRIAASLLPVGGSVITFLSSMLQRMFSAWPAEARVEDNFDPLGAMHDGLVVSGPGSSRNPAGLLVGVRPWAGVSCADARNRADPYFAPSIPDGGAAGWNAPEGTYAKRAWRAGMLKRWFMARCEKPVRDKLSFIEAELVLAGRGPATSALPVAVTCMRPRSAMTASGRASTEMVMQTRSEQFYTSTALREHQAYGAQTYASLYYLHKDIWDLVQQRGVAEAVNVASSLSDIGNFKAEAQWVAGGRVYTPDQLAHYPWLFWPATSQLGFRSSRLMLEKLVGWQAAPRQQQRQQQRQQPRQQQRQAAPRGNHTVAALMMIAAAGLLLLATRKG